MIQILTRELIYDLDFQEYLKIDAVSNSGMKSEGKEFKMSDKIMIGKEVDSILTEDGYVSENNIANNIARQLKYTFGEVIKLATPQVSILCDIACTETDLQVKMKTRPDFFFEDMLSVDLKVTFEKMRNIEALVKFMKYEEQCYLHRTLGGVEKSYLMIWSVPDKTGRLIRCEKDCSYWINKAVVDYGR